MDKAKILTILKRTFSVILGLGSIYAFYLVVDDFSFFVQTGTVRAADIRFLLIFTIPLAVLVSFSILWNIVKLKRVYLLLLVPLLGVGAFFLHDLHEWNEQQRWEIVVAERQAQRAQEQAAQEVQRVQAQTAQQQRRNEQIAAAQEAERVRLAAEQQARVDQMYAEMYANSFPALTVWAVPTATWANRREIGSVPYRTAVSLSRDQDYMVNSAWGGGRMVFIAQGDVRGWVFYSQLTETLEHGSLLGFWEEEGTGDEWRFDPADNSFTINMGRGGRWGSARGTYELADDGRVTFTFNHHDGLGALLGAHFDFYSPIRRRFSMDAELAVADEDRRILRISNRVVSVWD